MNHFHCNQTCCCTIGSKEPKFIYHACIPQNARGARRRGATSPRRKLVVYNTYLYGILLYCCIVYCDALRQSIRSCVAQQPFWPFWPGEIQLRACFPPARTARSAPVQRKTCAAGERTSCWAVRAQTLRLSARSGQASAGTGLRTCLQCRLVQVRPPNSAWSPSCRTRPLSERC